MNDFTKEELENIQHCIMTYGYECSIPKLLIDKVESMIENYKEPCKHEWNEFTSLVNKK